jgi:hypothetical protein
MKIASPILRASFYLQQVKREQNFQKRGDFGNFFEAFVFGSS